MSEIPAAARSRSSRPPVGASLWFVWLVVMWIAFFALLLGDRLDGLWTWVRDLPLVLELVLWVAFLPWVLGTAVWTSSWPDAVRVLLVGSFALGWTIISIPRRKKTATGPASA